MNITFFQSPVSLLINSIIQKYHVEAITVCIIWNYNFHFSLEPTDSVVITNIYKDIDTDFENETLHPRIDILTRFEQKLAIAIEKQHCESFIAFEEDISYFASSFMKSVVHSIWRSLENKFLFIYTPDRFNVTPALSHIFFKDQPNVLFVEIVNETLFHLKTTKFTGKRNKYPEELVVLDTYFGETNCFQFKEHLYPDKLKDLEGREITVAAFSYEPYSILKNSAEGNVLEIVDGKKKLYNGLHFDGTDAQIYFHFCHLYNCTVQVETKETIEWGFVYPNFTGFGILGLIFERKADIGMMAIYMWRDLYLRLDMSYQTSRSGITCLVPKPRRRASWFLPIEPFGGFLWFGIAVCLMAETIALIVTYNFHNGENRKNSWKRSITFGCSTSLRLFLSQSSDYIIKGLPIKTVLLFCYLFNIIITSLYGGGLASILTIPSFDEAADSVSRLAKHKLLWAGTTYDWILVFDDVKEERLQQILNQYRVYSSEDLQKYALSGKIGFVIERMQFGHFAVPDYLQHDAVDLLKIMTDDIYFEYCAAFTPRGWPLLNKYNNFIMMVQSSGLNIFWEWMVVAKYLDEKLQKQIDASSNTMSEDDMGVAKLRLENFAGIIILWIGGAILGVIIFLAELVIDKKHREEKFL